MHVDIKRSHVYIFMWHVDTIYRGGGGGGVTEGTIGDIGGGWALVLLL